MKRIASVVGLIGIVVYGATGPMTTTPAPMKEYWQDKIVKPDQAWIEAYGYNDASVLAFNVRRLYALCQAYQDAIQQLDARLSKYEATLPKPEPEIKPADPNESKAEKTQ